MSTQTLKLYEEVDQYETVLDWIAENADAIDAAGGELPPELDALLEEVQGRVQDKVERVGLVIRNLAANEKALDVEIERLQTRQRVMQRQQKTLKSYLKFQLERIGATRIDSARCPVRIQTNGGAPSIRLTDQTKAQAFFVTQEPVFSPKLALEAVRKLVPEGPCDINFEDLGIRVERGTHVRVG